MVTDDPKEPVNWALLARYFSGETTAAESTSIECWISECPERREEVAALRRVWQQAGLLPTPPRLDSMWRQVAESMHGEVVPTAAASASPLRVVRTAPRPMPWMGAARRGRLVPALAAAVLVLAVGFSTWGAFPTGSSADSAAESPRTFETVRGQTANVTLADGTRVVLGPDSRLRLTRFAASGPRELDLVGEAVFHVAYDPDRPFFVRSAFAVTEDLGTVFGVRAYPDDRTVQVVVVQGRVALRSDTAPLNSGTILEEGQLGKLDVTGKVEVELPVDSRAHVGWTEGRIVFRQASLREIATELSRRYDVRVLVSDGGVAGRRVTLDVPAEPLSGVLEAITVPLNLSYERLGDSIRIGP